jgi:hypothetical protein
MRAGVVFQRVRERLRLCEGVPWYRSWPMVEPLGWDENGGGSLAGLSAIDEQVASKLERADDVRGEFALLIGPPEIGVLDKQENVTEMAGETRIVQLLDGRDGCFGHFPHLPMYRRAAFAARRQGIEAPATEGPNRVDAASQVVQEEWAARVGRLRLGPGIVTEGQAQAGTAPRIHRSHPFQNDPAFQGHRVDVAHVDAAVGTPRRAHRRFPVRAGFLIEFTI